MLDNITEAENEASESRNKYTGTNLSQPGTMDEFGRYRSTEEQVTEDQVIEERNLVEYVSQIENYQYHQGEDNERHQLKEEQPEIIARNPEEERET